MNSKYTTRNERIAFAFARGARVQFFWQLKWWDANYVHVNSERPWRIHPDDEGLQYGPISTELRAAADHDVLWMQDSLEKLAVAALGTFENAEELGHLWAKAAKCNQLHKQLFMLFVAESFADEGL